MASGNSTPKHKDQTAIKLAKRDEITAETVVIKDIFNSEEKKETYDTETIVIIETLQKDEDP